MTDDKTRWVARLISSADEIATLIREPLGLDIWERHDDHLVVAATSGQLAEIERRRLARIERLGTVADVPDRPHTSTEEQE